MPDLEPSAFTLSSSSEHGSSSMLSVPAIEGSVGPEDVPSISMSSLFACVDPSLSWNWLPGGAELGTWTACGKGDDGRGFCADREALKEALVGVVASSTCLGWSRVGAPAGRGVVGEVISVFASVFCNEEFTGRKAPDIVWLREVGNGARWVEVDGRGKGERQGYAGTAGCGR